MGATYRHDYKAFGDLVLRSEWMKAEMERRALNVQANAEALAAEHTRTGRFERSFVTESGRTGGGYKHDRAFGRVRNLDPEASNIERGHDIPLEPARTASGKKRKRRIAGPRRHVEGLHTLTRSLDAAGD